MNAPDQFWRWQEGVEAGGCWQGADQEMVRDQIMKGFSCQAKKL